MTDDLRPYSHYGDSKQAWLGAIPAHWTLKRAKLLYREVDERSKTGEETLCSVSHKTGVTPRKANVTMFMAESTIGYKVCRPEDLVINTLWAWMAALGIAREVGVVSPAYGVYRPRPGSPLSPRYADLLLRTEQYKQEYIARSTGVNASRLRLYPEQFLQIPILLPPPADQSAIVRFLTALDRRVNRFVRAKRRLIELLTEQKQAIITHAVTRGLNLNAKLKPSGIDWLGDVPDHWKLNRFKRCVQFANGQVDPRESAYSEMILIAPEHLEKGTGMIIEKTTAAHQGAISGKYVADVGEVIYSKIRPALRKAAIAPCRCLCSADMYPLKPDLREMRSAYLLLLLLSDPFTRYAEDCSMRVAMPKINRDALGACWLSYPALPEQDAILIHVEKTSSPLNIAIERISREISLIREYRTRLVSDAVTGKLDVREAATRLPDDKEPAADAALETPDETEEIECETIDDNKAEAMEAAE